MQLITKENISKTFVVASMLIVSGFTSYKLLNSTTRVNAAAPCIVTLFGVQYDVSPLGPTHPGPKGTTLIDLGGSTFFQCGSDMTTVYQGMHGTDVSRMTPYLYVTPTATPTQTPSIPTVTITPTITPTTTPSPTTSPSPTITPTTTPGTTVTPTPTVHKDDDENEVEDHDEHEEEHHDRDDRHEDRDHDDDNKEDRRSKDNMGSQVSDFVHQLKSRHD